MQIMKIVWYTVKYWLIKVLVRTIMALFILIPLYCAGIVVKMPGLSIIFSIIILFFMFIP
jgi:hypothetical protein